MKTQTEIFNLTRIELEKKEKNRENSACWCKVRTAKIASIVVRAQSQQQISVWIFDYDWFLIAVHSLVLLLFTATFNFKS